jgi:hypothetical protein
MRTLGVDLVAVGKVALVNLTLLQTLLVLGGDDRRGLPWPDH